MAFSARMYEFAEKPAADARAPRTRTAIDATISLAPEFAHYVVMHDLSVGGVKVESLHPLVAGSEVTFDIPDLGRHVARVVWQRGDFYGCAFLTPLNNRQVKTTLADAKVVWADFAGSGSARLVEGDAAEPTLFPMREDSLEPESRTSHQLFVEPHEADHRWPLAARISFIIGGSIVCWTIVILPLVLIL